MTDTDKPEVTATGDDRRRARAIVGAFDEYFQAEDVEDGACDALSHAIAQALAETRERAEAPLRSMVDVHVAALEKARKRIAELEAENARLRKQIEEDKHTAWERLAWAAGMRAGR